jgi:TolA-binding protein
MQSKIKLTKRQVKEDRFTTSMLTFKDKMQREMEDNWQYYVIGLVVVVVLIWALAWQADRQSAKDVAAAEAFSRAQSSYQTGSDKQVAILEFGQIVETYGGSNEAGQATFLLGNLNLETRNYTEAIRYFQAYINDFGGDALDRAGAYAGIAAAHEDQGMYAEAAAGFVQASSASPDGPLTPDYYLGAMRNYLANGDQAQAEASLAELEAKHGDTDWAKRGKRLLAEKSSSE